MKLLACSAAAVAFLWGSTASAQVTVSIHNGLVTIVATDATTQQIIAEWARVGHAKVVNGDRIPGGPTTIELRDVPEAQALDMLLRSAAGYVAAPRPVAAANLSTFDRVVVLPTSNAPRTTTVSTPPPAFPAPQFIPASAAEEEPEEQPDQTSAPNARGPVFNAFPQQPQVINPQTGAPVTGGVPGGFPQGTVVQPQPAQQQPATFSSPSAPFGGVAVPGMMVPAPQPEQQPGQIVVPGQPGQVRRPGGR